MKERNGSFERLLPWIEGAFVVSLFLLGLVQFSGLVDARGPSDPISKASVPGYLSAATASSEEVCGSCHATEVALWRGSHHERAMGVASELNVLGVFDGREVEAAGETFYPYEKNDSYYMDVKDGGGKTLSYEVSHVFGVTPLQQYLVAGEGGRLQSLPLAWDSRPKVEGGQRWFDLYPGEVMSAGSPFHWTGRFQTWNTMCAECHSQGLKRNFESSSGNFQTTWDRMSVGCGSCHDPRSHPEPEVAENEASRVGPSSRWSLAEGAFTKSLTATEPGRQSEIEICAPCHSRRSSLGDGFSPGDAFLDNFQPRLLDTDLYHGDGQIREEVYVYGSFLQSKMFQAGVTCSDCHEPHSSKLREEGNELCAGCHKRKHFDSSSHHRHKVGSEGSRCTSCHMAEQVYMGVDARRDHAMRVPRPDLSKRIGAPDACTSCHEDRDQNWAIEAFKTFGWSPEPHAFGEAMAATLEGRREASALLEAIVRDETLPALWRGSAEVQLEGHGRADDEALWNQALGSSEPLVRLGAVEALRRRRVLENLAPLIRGLDDPLRAIRFEAAWTLAPFGVDRLPDEAMGRRNEVLEELVTWEKTKGERSEAQLNLAQLYEALDEGQAALEALGEAIRIDPSYGPAYINLAELLRRSEGEDAARKVLEDGLALLPDEPDLLLALGYSLVRGGDATAALVLFGRAAGLAPERPRFTYVFAVALHSAGSGSDAARVLEEALVRHPYHADMRYLAIVAARDRASLERHGAAFLASFPEDLRAADVRRALGSN
jgi:predicted CXXCH cytochrome family protein